MSDTGFIDLRIAVLMKESKSRMSAPLRVRWSTVIHCST